MDEQEKGFSYAKLMNKGEIKKESSTHTSPPVSQSTSTASKPKKKTMSLADNIRTVVKSKGYEPFTARITTSETERLEDAIYSVRKLGHKRADKTILTRIAINFLLEDFEELSEESMLVQVLEALNA